MFNIAVADTSMEKVEKLTNLLGIKPNIKLRAGKVVAHFWLESEKTFDEVQKHLELATCDWFLQSVDRNPLGLGGELRKATSSPGFPTFISQAGELKWNRLIYYIQSSAGTMNGLYGVYLENRTPKEIIISKAWLSDLRLADEHTLSLDPRIVGVKIPPGNFASGIIAWACPKVGRSTAMLTGEGNGFSASCKIILAVGPGV